MSSVFELAMSVLIYMGATKMQSLRSYEFSITAAILAMVPCLTPCCVMDCLLVFGRWWRWAGRESNPSFIDERCHFRQHVR